MCSVGLENDVGSGYQHFIHSYEPVVCTFVSGIVVLESLRISKSAAMYKTVKCHVISP